MRALRFFLLSILVLFLMLTGIGLFLPGKVTVSRAVDIQAPRTTIHALLADPSRWKTWFPGADSLPLVIKDGRAIGIKTPNGNLLSIYAQTDSTIEVQGLQTASVEGNMGFRLFGQGPITVQWYMNFQFDWYPWERFSSLLLENKFGLLMEQGLQKLQQEAQSGAAIN
jgi:hypothetical protein